MVALLQRELDDHAFTISKDDSGIFSLVTLKARREGEELCPLRGLLFDALSSLEGFSMKVAMKSWRTGLSV